MGSRDEIIKLHRQITLLYKKISSEADAIISDSTESPGTTYSSEKIENTYLPLAGGTVTGLIDFTGAGGLSLPHLMQSDSTTQSIANINNAQLVTFDTDVHSVKITRTSSSRFTFTQSGSYLIAISIIADLAAGANKHIEIWLRKNGVDVENSNTRVHLTSSIETVVAVTFICDLEADDYFEFWTWGDSTSCQWLATAAGSSPTRPAVPSIIMTCNQIARD